MPRCVTVGGGGRAGVDLRAVCSLNSGSIRSISSRLFDDESGAPPPPSLLDIIAYSAIESFDASDGLLLSESRLRDMIVSSMFMIDVVGGGNSSMLAIVGGAGGGGGAGGFGRLTVLCETLEKSTISYRSINKSS